MTRQNLTTNPPKIVRSLTKCYHELLREANITIPTVMRPELLAFIYSVPMRDLLTCAGYG